MGHMKPAKTNKSLLHHTCRYWKCYVPAKVAEKYTDQNWPQIVLETLLTNGRKKQLWHVTIPKSDTHI